MSRVGEKVARRYRLTASLGSGSYGEVYRATDPRGREWAIKFFAPSGLHDGLESDFLREVDSLQTLKGRWIVPIREVFYDWESGGGTTGAVVLELAEGSLAHRSFQGEELIQIVGQLFQGLEWIHRHGYVHRDLKPHNILLTSTREIRYADFGLTRGFLQGDLVNTQIVQTLWYRAPEVIFGDGNYDRQIDIWSLGCILFTLWTGFNLFMVDSLAELIEYQVRILGTAPKEFLDQHFHDSNNTTLYLLFTQRNPKLPHNRGIKHYFQKEYPDEYRESQADPRLGKLLEIIDDCLNWSPAQRPTAAELVTRWTSIVQRPLPLEKRRDTLYYDAENVPLKFRREYYPRFWSYLQQTKIPLSVMALGFSIFERFYHRQPADDHRLPRLALAISLASRLVEIYPLPRIQLLREFMPLPPDVAQLSHSKRGDFELQQREEWFRLEIETVSKLNYRLYDNTVFWECRDRVIAKPGRFLQLLIEQDERHPSTVCQLLDSSVTREGIFSLVAQLFE